MTDFNVRVVGSANLKQMTGPFAAFQAQVEALNAQLQKMVALQNGVDPAGYNRMAQAAAQNAKLFRSAASSTGMFEVEQLKLNRATDEYIKKLKAQKMSFRELYRERAIASKAYREQLAMENMSVMTRDTGTRGGKILADTIVPRAVSYEMNTAGKRLAFLNEQLKSGAHQMVNWGKNTQWAGRQLMVGFTMPILALGAAAGVMAYQVDKELTRVTKVYDTMANANSKRTEDMIAVEKELQQVREDTTETAMKAAREYGMAATDTLNTAAELAATGQQGVDLQKATAEVMRISRLGELDNQTAMQATIALQSTFRMSTDELTKSFNYMNAVENATSLTTQDFASAIPIAAAPIQAFGGDIYELGILLTAMRERGIEATQGANAIKAAMQRLSRPSKQIQEEFKALTGESIVELVDSSTSLTEIFTKLNTVTAGLSDNAKRDVFAGLFGSYQVSRMSALVEGAGDLQNGIGQVARAQELAMGKSSEWADIAEREMARYKASISGMWDSAFQELKLQLSTLGGPFIEFGTDVMTVLSNIIEGFNSLPGWIKKVSAVGVGLTALAGVAIMMTGLMANLAGNFLKVVAATLSLGVKMKILDRESRAAALASELANRGWVSQRSNVELLTSQLNKLIISQRTANEMQMRMAMMSGQGAGLASPFVGGMGPRILDVPAGPFTQQQAAALATKEAAEGTAKASEKTSRNMKVAAASSAAFSAAMVASMVSSNSIADDVFQYAMIASLALPALQAMAPLGSKVADAFRKSATSSAATSGNTAKAGKSLKGVLGGAKAAGLAFGAWMGPIGWTSLAVGAIGFGLYKWKKHLEEVKAEQERVHRSVMSMTDTWADGVGKVAKEYNNMAIAQRDAIGITQQQKLFDQYSTGDMAQVTKDFEGLDDTDQTAAAIKHFTDMQVKYGLTVEQARRQTEALYQAAGYGSGEAAVKVQELVKEYGNMSEQLNLNKYLASKIELFRAEDVDTDAAKVAADEVANAFTHAFSGATEAQATELMNMLTSTVQMAWQGAFAQLAVDSPEAVKALGLKTGEQLRAGVEEAGGVQEYLESQLGDAYLAIPPEVLSQFETSVNNAIATEESLVGAIAKGNSSIGIYLNDSIKSLEEFSNTWVIRSKQWDMDKADEKVKSLANEMANLQKLSDVPTSGISKEYLKGQKAAQKWAINQLNVTHGLMEGETYAEALYNWMHKVPADVASAAQRIRIAASATSSWITQVEQLRGALGSATSDIASGLSASFDTKMNNALDSRQAYWDSRAENLSNAMDKRQDGLDAAWDRRRDAAEKYWDSRIEKVEDQIEAEQKAEEKRKAMFEAEISRITRLNDMANRNIDFNVALNTGNLDEAAKIRNDAMAEDAAFSLTSANEKAISRSAKRIEKLEDKTENLEEQREAFMKDLEKREAAEKKHLQNVAEMRQQALSEQADADMEAARRDWELKKKHNEDLLELFQATTYKNRKQVLRALDALGLDYTDFAEETGEEIGGFFDERLRFYLKKAATEAKDDAAWDSFSKEVSNSVLKGMGFENLAQFRHFVETGTIVPVGHSFGDDQRGENRHAGGEIGTGGGQSRLGRRGGLRADEVPVTAQRGEFMINKQAYRKNKDVIQAINSNRFGTDYGVGGETGVYPVAGLMGGVIAQGFAKGAKQAMQNTYNSIIKRASAAASGVYAPGPGGRHRPVRGGVITQGIHPTNAIDIGVPVGTPVFSIADGRVSSSYDIPGYESRQPDGGNGYRSYGRVITVDHGDFSSLYAHLSSRGVGQGANIKGGSRIGLSGDTGNSSGPHLHFGVPGSNPYSFMNLQKGAADIRWDNTVANLHHGEAVLTKDINDKMKQGIERFANGSEAHYTANVTVIGSEIKDIDQLADKVVEKLKKMERRKPQSRRR